jgi:hypothetical protein
MAGAGEEADDAALPEHRRHHRDVVQVARRQPGVVGDVVVALAHRVRGVPGQDVLRAGRQGVHVARRAGHGLGHEAALQVEEARGEVAGFAHGGRKGGAHQGAGLFLDQRDQPAPEHLVAYLDGRRRGVGV